MALTLLVSAAVGAVVTLALTLLLGRVYRRPRSRRTPNLVLDALEDRDARYARALATIVPAEALKKQFIDRVYAESRAAVVAGRLDDGVAQLFCELAAERAGRVIERLEAAYLRTFRLPDLEALARLKLQVPKFDAKMARCLQRHIAEMGQLGKELLTEAQRQSRRTRPAPPARGAAPTPQPTTKP